MSIRSALEDGLGMGLKELKLRTKKVCGFILLSWPCCALALCRKRAVDLAHTSFILFSNRIALSRSLLWRSILGRPGSAFDARHNQLLY